MTCAHATRLCLPQLLAQNPGGVSTDEYIAALLKVDDKAHLIFTKELYFKYRVCIHSPPLVGDNSILIPLVCLLHIGSCANQC